MSRPPARDNFTLHFLCDSPRSPSAAIAGHDTGRGASEPHRDRLPRRLACRPPETVPVQLRCQPGRHQSEPRALFGDAAHGLPCKFGTVTASASPNSTVGAGARQPLIRGCRDGSLRSAPASDSRSSRRQHRSRPRRHLSSCRGSTSLPFRRPATGTSCGTSMYASTCSATRLNTGPADLAAVCAPTGESSTTRIVIAGSFTGAKPTNEAIVLVARIAPRVRIDLLRRAGFSRRGVAIQAARACRCRRAPRPPSFRASSPRSLASITCCGAAALRRKPRGVLPSNFLHNVRPIERSAVGHRRNRGDNLHRRDATSCPMAIEPIELAVQFSSGRSSPRFSPGSSIPVELAEAECANRVVKLRRAQAQRDLDRADVARMRQNLRTVSRPNGLSVVDQAPGD